MSGPRIIDLPNTDKKDQEAMLEELKREIPFLLKMYEQRCQIRYKVYQEHIKAGFTKEEAFSLLLSEVREETL